MATTRSVATQRRHNPIAAHLENKDPMEVGSQRQAVPRREGTVSFALHNEGPDTVYWGGYNVTVANGIPIPTGEAVYIDIRGTVYLVSDGAATVRVAEAQ